MQFQGVWFCLGFFFFLSFFFFFFLFAGSKKEAEGIINKPAFRILQEKPI